MYIEAIFKLEVNLTEEILWKITRWLSVKDHCENALKLWTLYYNFLILFIHDQHLISKWKYDWYLYQKSPKFTFVSKLILFK